MTTFNQIENLLYSKLDLISDSDYDHRYLEIFIIDLKIVIQKIEDDRYTSLTNNSLKEYNSKLIELISPFNDEVKYEELKFKVISYFNAKGYSSDFPEKENSKIFPIDPESDIYYDFQSILLPEHLEYEEGWKEYEYQQTIFDFFKLRLVKFLVNPPNKSKANNSKIKKFKEYFDKNISDNMLKKLKPIFNSNSDLKHYAYMTCILRNNKIINLKKTERKSFFRSWYNFIERPHKENTSFKGIYDEMADEGQYSFDCLDKSESLYVEKKNQVLKIFKPKKSSKSRL